MLERTLTRVMLLLSFCTLWKHQKARDFPIFSGSTERDQLPEKKNRYNNLCNAWVAVYGFCYRSCTFHWIIKIEITCCWAQILGGFSTFAGLPMFNKNTQCLVLLNFMVPHLHLEVNKYEEADVGTNFAGLLKKQWI